MILAQFTEVVLIRCCLREFKMNNSMVSEIVCIIGNGRSLEQPTCHLPFMSLSCLASNGSSASWRAEYPTGYL